MMEKEQTGLQQILGLDQAVMAAILEKTGPVTVCQEDIRRLLAAKQPVRAALSAEGSICLWTEGGTPHG